MSVYMCCVRTSRAVMFLVYEWGMCAGCERVTQSKNACKYLGCLKYIKMLSRENGCKTHRDATFLDILAFFAKLFKYSCYELQ